MTRQGRGLGTSTPLRRPVITVPRPLAGIPTERTGTNRSGDPCRFPLVFRSLTHFFSFTDTPTSTPASPWLFRGAVQPSTQFAGFLRALLSIVMVASPRSHLH